MEPDAQRRINELEQDLQALANEFRAYKQKQSEDEARRLKTALLSAGGIILALCGFMWAEIIWPVLKAGMAVMKAGKP